MNMNCPFLNLDCSCDKAMPWSSQKLTQNGLRVMHWKIVLALITEQTNVIVKWWFYWFTERREDLLL